VNSGKTPRPRDALLDDNTRVTVQGELGVEQGVQNLARGQGKNTGSMSLRSAGAAVAVMIAAAVAATKAESHEQAKNLLSHASSLRPTTCPPFEDLDGSASRVLDRGRQC
jgi:hypothetical protein